MSLPPLDEFKRQLKDDKLIKYLATQGIELRYDEKNDKVTIRELARAI